MSASHRSATLKSFVFTTFTIFHSAIGNVFSNCENLLATFLLIPILKKRSLPIVALIQYTSHGNNLSLVSANG